MSGKLKWACSLGLMFMASPSLAAIGLISPSEAHESITRTDAKKRPLLLDTRGGYKDYISGHLPTAHHINFDTLRGTDQGVPVQYLPEDLTRPLLERAGVDRGRQHILYAEGGTGDEILSASMVAYVLEKYGIEDIKIIDGGLPAYKLSYELSQEYPNTPRGTLPKKAKFSIGTDVKTVMQRKDQKNVVLVDARPKNEYLGEDSVWPRKGHIPGAVSFPWRMVMTSDNTHKFKPYSEVQSLLTDKGISPDKEIIVYCGTSREGSLLRFYLTHVAGYKNVVLYEGSWKEYAALKELPVETADPSQNNSKS